MVSYKKALLILLCTGGLLAMEACRKEKKEIEAPQKNKTTSSNQEKKKLTPIERLLSKNGQEIYEAQNELIRARKDLIARLINIVDEKENRLKRPASVRAAMFLLGEMRAVEAIGVLAEHIGFPYIREPGGEPRPGPPVGMGTIRRGLKGIQKTYPAVQALVKIGEPCLDKITEKLSSTDHLTEQKACLGVLAGLRQRDSVIEMLKDAIKKETDTNKQDRLESGLDLLAQMKE